MIMQSFTDMEKLTELLETDPQVKEIENAKPLQLISPTSPSVEFRNVKFSYGESTLLHGISFKYVSVFYIRFYCRLCTISSFVFTKFTEFQKENQLR